MSGMDGINSLQKMLGAQTTNESTNVNSTTSTSMKTGGLTLVGSSVKVSVSVDSASLSAAGGLASQAMTDTSDVRLTKVAELRQAIQSGTYNVSADSVADKMVDSMLG